jgi:hypothetical protein
MRGEFSRTLLIRQAWKASAVGRFSDAALFDSVASLADEVYRPKLRSVSPKVWLRLDDLSDAAEWIAAAELDAEAIDAVQSTIGMGLPRPGKKAALHAYALRPQDFPALLFLAFIAARMATPYVDDGSHRKVRAQFWFAPELAIILMRCLPPTLGLLSVEHMLRTILQPSSSGFRMLRTAGVPFFPPGTIGEPPGNLTSEDTMGRIEFPGDFDEDE